MDGEDKTPLPGPAAVEPASLDVLVATRNRPDDLMRLMGSLELVKWGAVTPQVWVIDQSDPEALAANRRSLAGMDAVTHVEDRGRGKSRALNLGLRRSSAPYVAFTDDDCTVPPDWPRPALRSLESDRELAIVFGAVHAADHDPRHSYIPAISFDTGRTVSGPTARSRGLLGMGANMVVRRSLLDDLGGFDEDLGPGGRLFTGEECELTLRSLHRGYAVRQEPELTVDHWGARPVTGGVARQLVITSFFGIGAGYGKHIRARRWRAALAFADEVLKVVVEVARNVVHRRRPLHIRHLQHLLKGAVAGFRVGPNVPEVAVARDRPEPF